MIKKIHLINYMSHTDTYIEPAAGLTVLIGPNNCGKSAVMSALQTLCYNERSNYMVRHGTNHSKVTLETEEGDVVSWERNKDVVSYTINGKKYFKTKSNGPDDLHTLLRLPLVQSKEFSAEKFDIHFGSQKDPIFLLNGSGRDRAMFFASSSDAIYLMGMQKKHKDKESQKKQLKKVLSDELEKVQSYLETLNKIQPLLDFSSEITLEYDTIVSTQSAIAELNRILQADQMLESKYYYCKRRIEWLTDLREVPSSLDSMSLMRLLGSIEDIQHRYDETQSTLVVLHAMNPPLEYKDPISLMEWLDKNTVLNDRLAKVQRRMEYLHDLDSPPEFLDPSHGISSVKGYENLELRIRKTTSIINEISILQEVPRLQDVSDLTKIIQSYQTLMDSWERINKTLDTTMAEIQNLRDALKETIQTIQVCPLCNSDLDAERILQHQHSPISVAQFEGAD